MNFEELLNSLEELTKKLDDKAIVEAGVLEKVKASYDELKQNYEAALARLKEMEEQLKATAEELQQMKQQEEQRKIEARRAELSALGVDEANINQLVSLADDQYLAVLNTIKNAVAKQLQAEKEQPKEEQKPNEQAVAEIAEAQQKIINNKEIVEEMILDTPDIASKIRKLLRKK